MRFLRRAPRMVHHAPELMSLAPKYSEESHGFYYSMVERALKRQPDVRNIALAGTYGTGKSSILHQVRKKFKKRVVEVSLLSLGAKPEEIDDKNNKNADVNPAAASKTNRIQKEIVKQLLYQQKPTDAPDSRFRRIARFRWIPEILTAVGLALVALIFVAVMGLDVETVPEIKVVFVDRPDGMRAIAAYVTAGILIAALVLGVRFFFRGRAAIEKLTAGPATITLPARSTSYFDEYLDEIIYFFEMNRKASIVIIEDLDRFDDPHIFESLRSLNSLLNSARQLRRRRIRFIYAMKDSVFGKLEGDEKARVGDLAQVELSRANRTKFFELIIPVVPFITHKNARDVLKELLKERELTISDDLVDVAARHVADMRLIKNIINEYQVFKNRLLDADRSVPGLDGDRLFAILLYKNVYLEDFEKIQHGTSQLDTLWTTWRELVRVNTERLHADTNARTRRVSARDAATKHAEELGTRLREAVVTLAAAPGTGLRSADIQFQGKTVSDETLASSAFWRQYLQSNDPLTIESKTSTSRTGSMQLSPAAIEKITGLSINSDDFVKEASERDRNAMADNSRELEFLRRHTWRDLASKPQFTYAEDGPACSFRGWIDDLLPSKLAADLVINGYLTAYFSLYVSAFYGQLIRPDAMIYVMRHVDSDSADPDYALEAEDVDAIIREEGRSVLAERSMMNVSILNHLLRTSDADSATVISNLPVFDAKGTFRDRYLVAGNEKERFVELLAPISPVIFTVLFDAPLEGPEKVRLLDAAARNRSEDQSYEFSNRLGKFLAEHVASFPTLIDASDEEAVRNVVSVFESSNAVIPDVTALAEPVRRALGASQAYVLNTANLTAVLGSDNLSLEKAQEAGEETFLYVLDNMAEYLRIVSESENTPHVVESRELFFSVLLQVDWTTDEFRPFIAAASRDCVVDDLTQYPQATWPALVAQHRAPMTWTNVSAYVDRVGRVDDDLATALSVVETITGLDGTDQTARRDVALAILNATSPVLAGSLRATLAKALDPGLLDVGDVEPMPGSMVGDLIKGGLLADDEATFASPLIVDWPTQAHAILSSQNFPSFIGPRTLRATLVPFVFQDDTYSYLFPQLVPAMRRYAGYIPQAFEAMADRAVTDDIELNGDDIEHARANGLRERKVIEVVAASAARVPFEQLLGILGRLGGEWAKVSRRGFGTHKVAAVPGAESVLERLKNGGIVSRARREGGHIKVSLRQPPK